MSNSPSTRLLYLLLQFESFQDTIRYYTYKASENKFLFLVYAIGSITVLTLIYCLLARKK